MIENLGKICIKKIWTKNLLIVVTSFTTQSNFIDRLEFIDIIKQ